MKISWDHFFPALNKTLSLFFTGLVISIKHSSRQLLCLICVGAFCGALAFGYFSQAKAPSYEKAIIGIYNLDENPFSLSMMNTLLEGENLSELMEVVMLPPDKKGQENCNAVLTIPNGFLESVLTGENTPPILEVRMDSPLESMWIRQMALAGARALTAAQLGIYAVLDAADTQETLDQMEYNMILADVNLTFLTAFFQRLSFLEKRELSASGNLTLPQYYITALAAGLVFCYGFLFHSSIHQLRKFSKVSGQGRFSLFFAAGLHLFLLQLLLLFILFCLFYQGEFPPNFFSAWLTLSLLSASMALLICLAFANAAICGAACLLLTLGQALLGGLLIPLALLPKNFANLAHFLPLWQGQQLFATPLQGTTTLSLPLLMSGAFCIFSFCFWMRKEGSPA